MITQNASTNVLESEFLRLNLRVKNVDLLTEKLFTKAKSKFAKEFNLKVIDLFDTDNMIRLEEEWIKIFAIKDWTLGFDDFWNPHLKDEWVISQVNDFFSDDLETSDLVLKETEIRDLFMFKLAKYVSSADRTNFRYSGVLYLDKYIKTQYSTSNAISNLMRSNIHAKRMLYIEEHSPDFTDFYSINKRIELYRIFLTGMNVVLYRRSTMTEYNNLDLIKMFMKQFESTMFHSKEEVAEQMIENLI